MGGAGVVLPSPFLSPPSRVLPPQFTEEKFGQAEKTELDAQFENLLARADSTKNWTEKILRQTEVLLQPNPSEWTRAGPGLGAGSCGQEPQLLRLCRWAWAAGGIWVRLLRLKAAVLGGPT